VRIFTKYLSQDATDPIGLDDVLRNQCISKYDVSQSATVILLKIIKY